MRRKCADGVAKSSAVADKFSLHRLNWICDTWSFENCLSLSVFTIKQGDKVEQRETPGLQNGILAISYK